MSRRFAGAGLMRRAARSPVLAAGGEIEPIADLGSALLYWWEASDDTVTLNGDNVSALAERVAGARNLVQATSGNQPAYHSSGGPNDQPYIELQDTVRNLRATGMTGIADDNRVGLFVVGAVSGDTGVNRILFETQSGVNAGVQSISRHSSDRFQFQVFYRTDGFQSMQPATPAVDTNWHVFSHLPLSTGALPQIDHATISSPFATTQPLEDQVAAQIGRIPASNVSGGLWASAMLVDLSSDAAARVAIVAAYYTQKYSL